MQFTIKTGGCEDVWVYDRDEYSYEEYLTEAGLTDPYRMTYFPHPASVKQKLRFWVSYILGRNKLASLTYAASNESLFEFLRTL